MSTKVKLEDLDKEIRAIKRIEGARRILLYTVYGMSIVLIVMYVSNSYGASKFDIDAGIAAATDPMIKGIKDHWGKGVLLTSAAGALIGEGDARQRGVRAGITAALSGGVILALIAMLT